MNINEMNDGNIVISEFTFNRKQRVLRQADQVIQLRKKESDVLALLCDKYPNPVSQDDFLAEVWGGGYVTSQSIAQVIRSLRLNLGDKKKSTISTIPKLGYKLTIAPAYEDRVSANYQYGKVVQVNPEVFSYVEQQPVAKVSLPSGAIPSGVIAGSSCIQNRKKSISIRKLILSTAILIFGSLACVTLGAGSNLLESQDGGNPDPELSSMKSTAVNNHNIIDELNEYITQCELSENGINEIHQKRYMYKDSAYCIE